MPYWVVIVSVHKKKISLIYMGVHAPIKFFILSILVWLTTVVTTVETMRGVVCLLPGVMCMYLTVNWVITSLNSAVIYPYVNMC